MACSDGLIGGTPHGPGDRQPVFFRAFLARGCFALTRAGLAFFGNLAFAGSPNSNRCSTGPFGFTRGCSTRQGIP